MDYFPPRIGFRIDKNFAVSLIFLKEESVDRSALKDAARFSRFPNILRNADILGRMAQLVEHIVHIDGVTGSSPVATTIIPGRKTWDSSLSTGFKSRFPHHQH